MIESNIFTNNIQLVSDPNHQLQYATSLNIRFILLDPPPSYGYQQPGYQPPPSYPSNPQSAGSFTPQSGYPQSTPGYPPQGSYPTNPGYPQSNPNYPQSNPNYPQSNSGYPPQSAYPSAGGYPPSSMYPQVPNAAPYGNPAPSCES